VNSFIKLGEPGEIGIVDGAGLADWAARLHLPHVAIEVYAQSAHPDRDRLIKLPRWIAWRDPAAEWTIGEFPGAGALDPDAPFDASIWKRQCDEIGSDPLVWAEQDSRRDEVLQNWREYCARGSAL
jgi:hypothetical protein